MSVPATLIGNIINGEYDEDLERLATTIRERQREVRQRQGTINRLTLTAGTKVRLRGLRPKYLNGITGTVVDAPARGQRIAVDIGPAAPRFGQIVHVPATAVEAV